MKRLSVVLAIGVLAATLLAGCVIVPAGGWYVREGPHREHRHRGWGYHHRPPYHYEHRG